MNKSFESTIMKKIISLGIALCMCIGLSAQKSYQLVSPNGEIKVSVSVSDKISYNIAYGDETLLENGTMQMQIGKQMLGEKPRVVKSSTRMVDENFKPVVPFKFSNIRNHYNQLLLKFSGQYSVEFRAFDDGVAYRFLTDKKGEVEVMNELFQVDFPEDYLMHTQQSPDFGTNYEIVYTHPKHSEWKAKKGVTLLPLLIEAKNNHKILISESSVSDYPHMFLASSDNNGIASAFPKCPIEFGENGDRSLKLVKHADYIAKTSGKRGFPWRYFVITKDDGQLIENTMTARLAEPSQIEDPSWIKPGLTTWEWWNGATPYGTDVDFEGGCNTNTYKYYIDFASKFGVEYILLDEGWAKTTYDPYTPNPNVDLHELIRYGKEKNVGVILWLTWLCAENHPELFAKFAEWGVKGVKIDFMDRSDQWMVDYYERMASEAAKHKLFVDFHGSFKPAGLEYKYPNVLSYEGVRGQEQNRGCHPDNSIFYPFMRNAVGPMDYTPGVIQTFQPQYYLSTHFNGGGIGTRAYQMALFVLFETGLQMLVDSPTLYYREEDCARFMAGIPLVTDETISLASKVGEYAIVAKKKGDKWYIGGMTNNKEPERVIEVSLDFLPEGQTWKMISYEDGVNANKQAMHYMKYEKQVKKGQKIKVKMARNGGFAAMLSAE